MKALNNAILLFEVGVKLGCTLALVLPLSLIPVLGCEHHASGYVVVATSMVVITSPPGSSAVPGSQWALTEHLIRERMDGFDYLLPESIA